MTNGEKYKTAKERAEAFKRYCHSHYGNCDKCAVSADCHIDNSTVALYWLDLEAEVEEPLPCPFCGHGGLKMAHSISYNLECHTCGYASSLERTEAEAIAAHNRVARAVKENKPEITEYIQLCAKEANNENT